MKMKLRETLHVDFSDYSIYAPNEKQALANTIYSLSASLIAKYLENRLPVRGKKMPDDLLRLRALLKNMWFDPEPFMPLQAGDKAGLETSLLVYCEDWIDLDAYERDTKYNKIRDVIYYSNTLFAKIFLRSMHHEAAQSKIIAGMITKPAHIKELSKPVSPSRKKKEAKAKIEFTPLELLWHKSFDGYTPPHEKANMTP